MKADVEQHYESHARAFTYTFSYLQVNQKNRSTHHFARAPMRYTLFTLTLFIELLSKSNTSPFCCRLIELKEIWYRFARTLANNNYHRRYRRFVFPVICSFQFPLRRRRGLS